MTKLQIGKEIDRCVASKIIDINLVKSSASENLRRNIVSNLGQFCHIKLNGMTIAMLYIESNRYPERNKEAGLAWIRRQVLKSCNIFYVLNRKCKSNLLI